MADILLSVPYVTQVSIGGHVVIGLGRTENMGCWYAAVSMLGCYREAGPRLGKPAQYVKADGKPLQLDAKGNIHALGMGENYPKLVKNEGLTLIPLPESRQWMCDKLADLLRDCGPCYMRTKLYGADGHCVGGHILVLVGAKSSVGTVTIHDPAKGPNIELAVDDLNGRFNWDDTPLSKYSMMCKLPSAAGPRANAISR